VACPQQCCKKWRIFPALVPPSGFSPVCTIIGSICSGPRRPVSARAPLCAREQAGGVQEKMKPAAAVALVVYAVGIPLAFLYLLVRHRVGIKADQVLKLQGLGNTSATNPNFHIRRRLQKLYVPAHVYQ
jgi:hypothetical protein